MKKEDFLSAEEHLSLEQAIEAAELNTSGEIRIHIENSCKDDVLDRATSTSEHIVELGGVGKNGSVGNSCFVG